MSRSVPVRIEFLVLAFILILCIVMAEFPVSMYAMCPKLKPANCGSSSSAPSTSAPAGSSLQGNSQQSEDTRTSRPPTRSTPPAVAVAAVAASAPCPPSTPAAVSTDYAGLETEQFSVLNEQQQQQQRQQTSKGVALESNIESELAEIGKYLGDKSAQKALLDAAAAAARDGHRAYSSFTQSLKNIATLSRAAHIRDVSRTNFAEQPQLPSDEPSASPSKKNAVKTIEFFRFHSSASDDAKLSVPSIPTDLNNLAVVAPTSFGLVAGFSSAATKTSSLASSSSSSFSSSSSSLKNTGGERQQPQLKVATLLTGHMRGYARCAERLVQTVLGPTDATLFIATYPDKGEKRYGVRDQQRFDDAVNWAEVLRSYSPHLAGLFVAEVPLMRRRLELAFPAAFGNLQFSWMLYQFLLIELGVNMTEAFAAGWDLSSDVVGEMSFGSWPKKAMSSPKLSSSSSSSNAFSAARGVWPWGHLWKDCGAANAVDGVCSLISFRKEEEQQSRRAARSFDVFIRLRPDLFIVGTVKLIGFPFARQQSAKDDASSSAATPRSQQVSFESFQFEVSCGSEARTARNYGTETSVATFDSNVVLVAPHHPRNMWYLDKTSDLSLVAAYPTARRYLSMYSDLSHLTAQQQGAVFVPLCTAERLWNTRAKALQLVQNRSFGWFAMLRNKTTFQMSSVDGHKSPVKRAWIRSIFAVFDSDTVPCPFANGTMATVPPSQKRGKGKK